MTLCLSVSVTRWKSIVTVGRLSVCPSVHCLSDVPSFDSSSDVRRVCY